MTITSRLKKLENKINVADTVCACFPRHTTEIYYKKSGDSEPKLSGEPVPDRCRTCGKATDKTRIIVEFSNEKTKIKKTNK